jgi:hypothetical protein
LQINPQVAGSNPAGRSCFALRSSRPVFRAETVFLVGFLCLHAYADQINLTKQAKLRRLLHRPQERFHQPLYRCRWPPQITQRLADSWTSKLLNHSRGTNARRLGSEVTTRHVTIYLSCQVGQESGLTESDRARLIRQHQQPN